MTSNYKANSITLPGAIAMGTGVMIGAGIFALTGQIAELAGPLFPLSFVVGAIVTAFSAYTYIKMSNAYPSAGGIGMILKKAYGPTTVAAGAALLMALSMVINESLVARTFGTYTLRAFDGDPDSVLVPVLGVGLWASVISFEATGGEFGAGGFVASVALTILAFKGFTTITNSGAEVTDPHHNVGRSIVWSIAILRQARHHKGRQCPEYISGKLMEWAEKRKITIQHVQPGQPQQNAYIERYNRTSDTNGATNTS